MRLLIHHVTRRWKWHVFIVLVTVIGCKDRPALPDEAYGYADEPHPQGAQTITEAFYLSLVDEGRWIPVTKHSARQQEALEQAQDERDEATILEAGETIPADPPEDDEDITPTADGNYVLQVPLNEDETMKMSVVTHGRRWFLRLMANRIRNFPTRENQLVLYQGIYDGLPEKWRTDLELVSPDVLNADIKKTGADLMTLNQRFSGPDISAAIIADLAVDFLAPPPEFLKDCDREMGAGLGLDQTENDDPKRACGIRTVGQTRGVVNAHQWLLKPYITCVKNQAGRGTCTGFANTSAIEMLVWKTHGHRVNLSEQAYYNRARSVWEPGDFGDGHMSEVGFYKMRMENFLLYFEDQWNYNPSSQRKADKEAKTYSDSCVDYEEVCSDSTHQSAFACVNIDPYKHCGYWVTEHNPNDLGFRIGSSAQFWNPNARWESIELMRLLLSMGYPLILGQPITDAWKRGGILSGRMPYWEDDTIHGGHGTHIVGFIDNDDLDALRVDGTLRPDIEDGVGGGYFIVKNSWTNCWGDGGFIYVPYQSVHDYAQDITALFEVL